MTKESCAKIIDIILTYPKDRIIKRGDGRIEWVCDHGIGHTIFNPNDDGKYSMVHGCDGCCSKLDL